MNLLRIKYTHRLEIKHFHVVEIGIRNHKLVCLLDKFVSEKDAAELRANTVKLADYTLDNKIKWIKETIPELYKKGYKEILLDRITIEESVDIPNF